VCVYLKKKSIVFLQSPTNGKETEQMFFARFIFSALYIFRQYKFKKKTSSKTKRTTLLHGNITNALIIF